MDLEIRLLVYCSPCENMTYVYVDCGILRSFSQVIHKRHVVGTLLKCLIRCAVF